MKKYLMLLVGILSFIGVSQVKADTITWHWSHAYNLDKSDIINDNTDIISKLYDDLLEEYSTNYKESFPYYYISLAMIDEQHIWVELYAYSEPTHFGYLNVDNNIKIVPVDSDGNYKEATENTYLSLRYEYNFIQKAFIRPIINLGSFSNDIYLFDDYYNNYNAMYLFYANYDIKYISKLKDLYLENYKNESNIIIKSGDMLPLLQNDLKLNIMKDPSAISSNYVEVDLNNYPYIALSLKDYSLRNDEINQFSTNIYTKGQLCLTPVYNYGMDEKIKVYGSGYQVQGCSVYYENYTPVRTYILKQDLENHAIYYLKAYDSSKDNLVKIDTSIFDITYISSENADNPTVTINGRSYPTIAYDDLSSTSTKSEEEGYISGVSCAVGDLNCTREFSDMSWTDIFSNPLQALKDVWVAITAIFSLITSFILLLPPVMQAFLYSVFGVSIALGIIKIIL